MMKKNILMMTTAAFCLIMAFPAVSFSRTAAVVLSQRQSVDLTFTSGKSKTLVQEKRLINFEKGMNAISFSWQNARIDPGAILFSPMEHAGQIQVLSTDDPPGSNSLIWHVHSKAALSTDVMISYLIGGMDAVPEYQAMIRSGETRMDLDTRLVIRNFSGEDFPGFTGTLNAGRSFSSGIMNQETRKISMGVTTDLPVKKIILWKSMNGGTVPQPSKLIPVVYQLEGLTLQAGRIRMFSKDGDGRNIFSGENLIRMAPEGKPLHLEGPATGDIKITGTDMKVDRIRVQKNDKGQVQAYEEIIERKILVKNFSEKAAEIHLLQTIAGEWEPIDIDHKYEKQDHETLKFVVRPAPGKSETVQIKYRVRKITAPGLRRAGISGQARF